MLHVIVGENVFQRDAEVAKLVAGRAIERIEGDRLTPARVGEVFAGQTLFSDDIIKIVDNASADSDTWSALEPWLERGVEADVILLEQKLDKRTKVYKLLQKTAKIITCDYWTERQRPQALSWLRSYTEQQGATIPSELYDDMVERSIRSSDTGKDVVIDQQRLARAVEQLKHAETVDRTTLDTVLAPSVHENVFRLLTQALDGDVEAVRQMLFHLRREQEGHRMFGLLGSQVGNLAALVLGGDRSTEQVASDIGAHPYSLKQLVGYRRRIGRQQLAQIIASLADADVKLKHSQAEPWVLIEKALVEIALIQKKSRS